MAQSLTKSSASLVAAGGDLAEAAALTATANAIIQDADSVGTALKTTSLRLRGTSVEELEKEGVDSDGAVESTSKLQSKIKALSGVDILTETGEYKSTYQILSQIADVWADINDMDQAALLELLAGKRNASVLAAILQAPEQLKEAYGDAQNAEGSALKENERYLDSIQGKIDQFNNAVQAMWSDTLDSDAVKFFVDLGTQLIKIVDAVGPLNIAFVGLLTFLEKKHGIISNLFKPTGDGVDELKKQLVQAEKDLAKATQADTQRGNKKTAQNRRDAEERVAILKSKIQESSSEAVLDGIDDSFDPNKVKKQIGGKRGAITKRAKKLEGEGETFAQIQEDPKIKQWTQEVKEGEQALNDYNAKVAQADATLKQKNATTTQAAGAERAKAGAEVADASATNAGANADRLATAEENKKTAATWADVWATLTNKDASLADVAAKIKQILLTKILSMEYVKQAIANGTLTKAQIANMTATQLLGLGFKGLAAGIKAATLKMWEFMTTTPIGWILLAVGAVVALGAAFSAMHKTTEELQEELDGFKSELSDIRSELDSVNQELETTNERMEELLAKDKLTFEEQEELDRLRATNDELERRKELLESEKEHKEDLVGRQASKVVSSKRNEIGWWLNGKSRDEEVLEAIDQYRNIKSNLDSASSLDELNKYQEELDAKGAEIDEYIAVISEALDGVEYGDSEESDEALDYLAELQDTYAIARGSAGAKTNSIKGIFNKDEFSNTKIAIDQYVKALKDGDMSAAESIANMIKSNYSLVKDLKARGLEAQDAIDYFVKLGDTARFDTVEGKTKEIEAAKSAMDDLMNSFKSGSINVDTLFDEDGKIIQTKLSEMFKGTSEKTRAELTKLLEGSYDQIANGLNDDEMESLISRFGIKMEMALLEVKNNTLAEQNIELFPNLKDEIDGIIDSFDEMVSSLNGVVDAMDLLEQARKEEAYSGSISLETMAKLMEQTDDYSKILSVDEYGAITLVQGAEDILIDQRIEKIKTDAKAALAVAEKTNQEAIAAEQDALNAKQTLEMSGPTQQWYIGIMSKLAGAIAYVGSLWNSLMSGNFNGMFDRAEDAFDEAAEAYVFEKSEKEHQEKLAKANAAYEAAVVARENSDKEYKIAKDNENIASKITRDNIKASVSSDYADGTNDDKRDEMNDAFQKEMEYWENRLSANQSRADRLQNTIDLLEKKGMKASAQYYRDQMTLLNSVDSNDGVDSKLELLNGKLAAVTTRLGQVARGSEEWWEAAKEHNDIVNEIQEIESAIVDMQDAIAEIDTYKFEEFINRLDSLTGKLGTIRDLIAPNGEEDWFDDEGNFTEKGVAVLGSHVQELEFYKQGLEETKTELNKYNKAYSNNTKAYYEALGIHSEQEFYDKVSELTDQQYDFAESISDTEQSIVDMYESNIDAVEEYIETLIDGYNDYIDSVKEALDAERDLYEFKKNVQKQAKDIASLERRIASLSGSTNKSEIAERRKLEAELYDARESLNDTYYDHAKDAQNNALDAERSAYEETMNKFVQGMRTSLETATMDMNAFLGNVTTMVSLNAGAILEQYQQTELPLDDALTNPWEAAKKAVGDYSGDALDLMNKWAQSGFLTTFPETVSKSLKSPWDAGKTAAGAFKTSVDTVMDDVVKKIGTNVETASSKLSALYKQIKDANEMAANIGGAVLPDSLGDSPDSPQENPSDGKDTETKEPFVSTRKPTPTRPTFKKVGDVWSGVGHTGVNIGYKAYNKALEIEGDSGIFYPYKNGAGYQGYIKKGEGYTVLGNGKMDIHSMKPLYQKYAKGTTGTTHDQWAITDEPQFGDELVLVPGKDGNLSFMRKGTGVVPADMTQKLFELAQIPTSDLMNKNLTAIVPNITKNDFKNEFNFESLVHVDTVDSDTLPKLEKMVDKKIDDFSKALNYSLKRFAR